MPLLDGCPLHTSCTAVVLHYCLIPEAICPGSSGLMPNSTHHKTQLVNSLKGHEVTSKGEPHSFGLQELFRRPELLCSNTARKLVLLLHPRVNFCYPLEIVPHRGGLPKRFRLSAIVSRLADAGPYRSKFSNC